MMKSVLKSVLILIGAIFFMIMGSIITYIAYEDHLQEVRKENSLLKSEIMGLKLLYKYKK